MPVSSQTLQSHTRTCHSIPNAGPASHGESFGCSTRSGITSRFWIIGLVTGQALPLSRLMRLSVLMDQVLPDSHRVATPRQLQLDQLPIRFTGSGWALATLLRQPHFRQKADNHFVGRF
jgi:hypothetical protein